MLQGAQTQRVQQPSINPISVLTAVITSLGAMTITLANRSNQLVDINGNSLVNLSSAGEKLTAAVDKRAGIYGDAIVENGKLAEREHTLKQKIRLAILEEQEKSQAKPQAKAAPKTRKTRTTKKTASKKNTHGMKIN